MLLNAHTAAGDTWMHVHEDSGLFLQKRWKFMLWSGRAGVKIFHITWMCFYSQMKSYCSRASNNTSGYELRWHCHVLHRRETCHWKLLYCHWGWHTTIVMKNLFWTCACAADSQQQTHTHLQTFIFIIFCFSLQQMPGFRSCAPRPIRNTDSSLYKATAPFIKVH